MYSAVHNSDLKPPVRNNEMFVNAIERTGAFTRAIHTIIRYWGSEKIVAGSGTLFFINAEGWALTCAHVAQQFAAAAETAAKFAAFKAESGSIPRGKGQRHALNLLERKYAYKPGEILELHSRLVGCVDGPLSFDVIGHPTLDIALLKFNGFKKLLVDQFPVFGRDSTELKPGKTLCRLGFPFPEFSNYGYDPATDLIGWTDTGQESTPRFPIDGMLTRHVADGTGNIVAFELSTPGIRGQSGGPAFDRDGRIWGMQSQTKHLDLDFDVDTIVFRGTAKKRVQDSAFLHVGVCIHVDALKDFIRQNGVTFQEG
ncbi:MAG: trypsin-like peptidase domain-containing protein [Pyrinomonadaceae bacterium]